MNGIIEIEVIRLFAAYLLALGVLFLARKTGAVSEILVSLLRMSIQLVLVGFLLEHLLERPNLVLTLLVFLAMEAFAVHNIFRRVPLPTPPGLKRVIIASMVIGTVGSVGFFLVVIVGVEPWYAPRYFIPLGGMLIGNSMTGISLGFERLAVGIRDNSTKIEGALMLGASVRDAAHDYAVSAFRAAIMPTVNAMMGMGVVFLPGMMTGQILSGSSPVTAIRYQIAIMLGIFAAVALTVYLMTEFGYRCYFNHAAQLQVPSTESTPRKAPKLDVKRE